MWRCRGPGACLSSLQFAKLVSATVILTSSEDSKLARGKALGADHLINYRTEPEWSRPVKALTDGRGADLIVEIGGAGTLAQSIRRAGRGHAGDDRRGRGRGSIGRAAAACGDA